MRYYALACYVMKKRLLH